MACAGSIGREQCLRGLAQDELTLPDDELGTDTPVAIDRTVEEAGEESIPVSDPPAWTLGREARHIDETDRELRDMRKGLG